MLKITKNLILSLAIVTSCNNKEKIDDSNAENQSIKEDEVNPQLQMKTKKMGLFSFSDKLIVRTGEVLTITPEMKYLITREWVMEDSSRINFAPGVQNFVVNAEEIKWGNGVVIDARGKNGILGKNGIDASQRSEAGDCASGFNGGDGGFGTDGGGGVNIDLTFGISELGSAKVIASGGNGGHGGKGGNGMSGTKGDCSSTCNGGNGGNSGRGGTGGNAGNGGNVSIAYKFLSTGMDIGALIVVVEPGNPGLGGNSGTPGIAGSGKGCDWPFKDRSAGKNGINTGTLGNGEPGTEGKYHPEILKTINL